MFRRFALDQNLRERLLGLPDGERALTNVQHAAECLHCAEHDQSLTPPILIRWMQDRRERTAAGDDSHLIRLEKDEKAVQIVTIHRSKGLEYPVVFVPFNWTNILPRQADPVFHDPANNHRLTWDMRRSPPEETRAAFQREQLAESLRLLYVAVTRARHRCHLFWAETRDSLVPGKSPLAWLFQQGDGINTAAPAAALRHLADAPGCRIHDSITDDHPIEIPRRSDEARTLKARTFNRKLPHIPLITSFSGLTAGPFPSEIDRYPHAPSPSEATAATDDAPNIFNFPKGTRTGNFFHTLLENLDFTNPSDLREKINAGLSVQHIDKQFAPVVERQIHALLDAPLAANLRLGQLPSKDRRPELAFYYPIQRVTHEDLRNALGGEVLPAGFAESLGRLVFRPADGYLTGFIDLVFRFEGRYFLLDWKSNWLGPVPSDYTGQNLVRAMAAGHYPLQYHIYTLALHRHLGRTLPDYDYETHFGGVLYLFLRGIQPGDPSGGIFLDRPPAQRIHCLEQLLLGGKAVP